jgi:hypothetical protein
VTTAAVPTAAVAAVVGDSCDNGDDGSGVDGGGEGDSCDNGDDGSGVDGGGEDGSCGGGECDGGSGGDGDSDGSGEATKTTAATAMAVRGYTTIN